MRFRLLFFLMILFIFVVSYPVSAVGENFDTFCNPLTESSNSSNYYVYENFEGSGTPSGWACVGGSGCNFDYTTYVFDGNYSFSGTGNYATYPAFTESGVSTYDMFALIPSSVVWSFIFPKNVPSMATTAGGVWHIDSDTPQDFGSYNTTTWYKAVMVVDWDSGNLTAYAYTSSGDLIGSASDTFTTGTDYDALSLFTNEGVLDNVRMYNGSVCPIDYTPIPYLNIGMLDLYNSSGLEGINVTLADGSSNLTDATGYAYFTNKTSQNFTAVDSFGFYFDFVPSVLPTENSTTVYYMNPHFVILDYGFSNFTISGGVNYTRDLVYFLNASCESGDSISALLYVNGSAVDSFVGVCNNQSFLLNDSYRFTSSGSFEAAIYVNSSYDNGSQDGFYINDTFVWDLVDPEVVNVSIDVGSGFSDPLVNVSFACVDDIFPDIDYLAFVNDDVIINDTNSSGTILDNTSIPVDGSNEFVFNCSDPFSSSSYVVSYNYYVKSLILIDEVDNVLFDTSYVAGARVYFDDNSTFFDFKNASASSVNFTTNVTDKLRFELTYASGDVITRYVDVSLDPSDEMRICANKENITHYEQIIISATQRASFLKSVFSNCIVAADYTRFAYQDAFALKAFTINSPYYLYLYDENGDQVFLASVDGSIQTFINLDTLEFAESGYNLNIQAEAMSFESLSNTTLEIYYANLRNDSIAVSVEITRLDTNAVVFTSSSFSNPNEFTIIFDFSTLANVTEATLFRVEIERTTSSGTISRKWYFNTVGNSGTLPSGMVFIICLLCLVAALTMAAARDVFGWFGIVICLFVLGFSSMAISVWYILFMQLITVMLMIYFFIVLNSKNYPQVS